MSGSFHEGLAPGKALKETSWLKFPAAATENRGIRGVPPLGLVSLLDSRSVGMTVI